MKAFQLKLASKFENLKKGVVSRVEDVLKFGPLQISSCVKMNWWYFGVMTFPKTRATCFHSISCWSFLSVSSHLSSFLSMVLDTFSRTRKNLGSTLSTEDQADQYYLLRTSHRWDRWGDHRCGSRWLSLQCCIHIRDLTTNYMSILLHYYTTIYYYTTLLLYYTCYLGPAESYGQILDCYPSSVFPDQDDW